MKKILLGLIVTIVIGVLLNAFIIRSKQERTASFSANEMAGSEEITEFNVKVNTKQQAFELMREWLMENTDFTKENNEIAFVNQVKDYFEISLDTAININGRVDGYIGYRDYVITKDGKLKGYYMSK